MEHFHLRLCLREGGMLRWCRGRRSDSDPCCWAASTKPGRDLRSDPWTSCGPRPAPGWRSAPRPRRAPRTWTGRCQTWRREERGWERREGGGFILTDVRSHNNRIYLLTQYADVRAQQGLIRVPLQRGPPSFSWDWSHTDTCHGHVVLTENEKQISVTTPPLISLWVPEGFFFVFLSSRQPHAANCRLTAHFFFCLFWKKLPQEKNFRAQEEKDVHRRLRSWCWKKKKKSQNEATSISDICWLVEDSSQTECSTLKNRAQPVTDMLYHW